MRKSNLKKGMAALLTAAMAAGLMTGCGSDSGNDSNADGSAAQNSSAVEDSGSTEQNDAAGQGGDGESAGGSYADYSNGFENQVTIQIPVYDRAFEGWNVTDNYYTQWVQSEFGDKYNINVEYVAIGRQTEVTDYMQLLASGNAPDIIMHYDMPQAVNYYGEDARRRS